MALTPEDVVNKRFQPTKFREGYDQDEVDDFLDEVVVELRRLNQENEELRQRLIASDSRINELQRSAGQSAPQAASSASPFDKAPEGQSAPQAAPSFVSQQPADSFSQSSSTSSCVGQSTNSDMPGAKPKSCPALSTKKVWPAISKLPVMKLPLATGAPSP